MSLLHFLAVAAADNSNAADIRVAVISVVGVIAAALFSYLASRYSARQATRASATTDKVTERQVDVGEWKELVGSLQTEVKRLSSRVDDLEKKDDTNRQRIESLETAVRASDTKYHMALTYIRDVIAWTKAALHTDAVPPTAPIPIQTDLNNL